MRSSLILACTALSILISACGGGGNGPAPAAPPPVNTVPVAFDVAETTNMGEALEAALNGQDGDGDALTYSITELPTLGNVEILDAATGAFRFTPFSAAFGTDLFRYRVNDGNENSPEAVATILINRRPLAGDASVVETWCPTVNLFPDATAAEAWAAASGATGRAVPVAELADEATAMWTPITAAL